MKYYFYLLIIVTILSGCRTDSDITSPDDGIPPAVPSGVVITFANDGEIELEWNRNREPDWKAYNVYRSFDNAEYIKIASLDIEFFLDDSLEYDNRYYYRISAVDNSGKESSLSPEVSAIPVNVFPPDKPLNLLINGRNYQGIFSVYLNWFPGYESDITGYNVYRSTNQTFNTDSTTFIGFSPANNYSDTSSLELYTSYYYKIRGVDKGGLIGKESDTVKDMIFGIPEVLYPLNNSSINPFPDFVIRAIEVPAAYTIVVQTNEFFGELWSTTVNTGITNNTLAIRFNPPFLSSNKKYYWRIAVYSKEAEPNSISPLYNFTIKP